MHIAVDDKTLTILKVLYSSQASKPHSLLDRVRNFRIDEEPGNGRNNVQQYNYPKAKTVSQGVEVAVQILETFTLQKARHVSH
jgi:hypothetical protein